MKARSDALAFLAMMSLVAGCVTETRPNKAWFRCKDDPCSDGCPADLREIYCEYYVDDAKYNRCWPPGDAGEDSGANGGDGGVSERRRDLDCDIATPRCSSGACPNDHGACGVAGLDDGVCAKVPCASSKDCSAGLDLTTFLLAVVGSRKG